MNRSGSAAGLLLASLLASTMLAAGCGVSAVSRTTASARPLKPPSLATSLSTADGTWAAAVMGGSAASHNNFWQLFVRPAGTRTWRLATPPGVASNGGLVLAGLGAGSLLTGFRPSQKLSYSPLATTRDNGKSWTPGLLDARLADVPGALAADPGHGRLLALLTNGSAEISGPGGTSWTRLTSRTALGASAAGARCQPASLTAAAFSASGQPLLGAGCGRPGTAGIFSRAGPTWKLAGPALPAGYAHQVMTVVGLSTSGPTTTALLAAGAGPSARLLASWSADGGAHWTLSPPLPLKDAAVTSVSSGPGHSLAVTLSDRRADTITKAAASWRPVPALPPGTATLAPDPSGGWDALAVHATRLTIWRAAPSTRTWTSTQVIKVPVPYGSSG